MSETELIAELQMLAGLNEPRRGGPYQGAAAERCVAAMAKAATALQQALAERDEAREGHAAARENFHTMQGAAAELRAELARLTAALSAETEACAAIAEAELSRHETDFPDEWDSGATAAAESIAAAIRQRQGERS